MIVIRFCGPCPTGEDVVSFEGAAEDRDSGGFVERDDKNLGRCI